MYKFDGTFIKTIKKTIVDFTHWSNDIFYFNNSLIVETYQNNESKYLLSSFDLKTDSIYILYKDYTHGNVRVNYPQRIQPIDAICYQNQDSVFLFKEIFNDTIFKVNSSFKVEPKWILDIIKYELKREELIESFKTIDNPKGYYIHSFAESSNFLFFFLRSESDRQIFGIYNRTNDSIKLVINENVDPSSFKIVLENDLDKIVKFYPIGPLGNLFCYNIILPGFKTTG